MALGELRAGDVGFDWHGYKATCRFRSESSAVFDLDAEDVFDGEPIARQCGHVDVHHLLDDFAEEVYLTIVMDKAAARDCFGFVVADDAATLTEFTLEQREKLDSFRGMLGAFLRHLGIGDDATCEASVSYGPELGLTDLKPA